MEIDAVTEYGQRFPFVDRMEGLFLLEGDGRQHVLQLNRKKEGEQPMGIGDQRVRLLAIERDGRVHLSWYFVVDYREDLTNRHSC